MKFSKLKYDIKQLKLKHHYESETLQMKHELEMKQLTQSYNHKYDDGTDALIWYGGNRGYSICNICGKIL